MSKVKLSKIAEIQAGPFGTQLHKNEYVTDGIIMLNAKNIGNGEIPSYAHSAFSLNDKVHNLTHEDNVNPFLPQNLNEKKKTLPLRPFLQENRYGT